MKDFSFQGFNGLARQYPVVAFTATIFLLSLAGIPLTGGFLAKYYMVAAVMQTGTYLWLVIFALLCATVSVYYYFKVIQAMYFKDGPAQTIEISGFFKGMLVLLAVLVILLGIFPQWLTDMLGVMYVG